MANDRISRRPAPAPGPVALFIDWDNFAIGLRQEMPDRPPDLGPILRWARKAGTLIVSRAYGEWRDPTERLAIYNAGVEAVYAPVLPLGGSLVARNGAGGAKSLADTAMAVDVAEFLMLMPSITRLIMATSDKDLIPVVRLAQRRGVFAGVVGSDRTASALSDLADEFVTYRQLLEAEAPQPLAISRPVTVPPLRVARGFRRPGEGLSATSPSSQGLSRIAPPTILVNPPSIPAQLKENPEVRSPEGSPDDDPSVASRRRRRGGRRRRGAETLAIVGSGTSDALEADEAEGLPEQVTPGTLIVDQRPSAQSASREPRSSATTRPQVASPIARSIVAPMISPPPFRTRANDGLPPLEGRPQPVLINSSSPDEPINPADDADALASVVRTAPPELQPAVAEPWTVTSAATLPSPPRVQLPGEKLRRFVAPQPEPDSFAAQPTSPTFETEPPAVTPSSAGDPEYHVATSDEITSPKAPDDLEPVASSPEEVDHAGVDAASAAPVAGTSRARRRRGGRPVRGAGSPDAGTGEAVAEAIAAPAVDLVPEPVPNGDAVEASDSTPDGRPRGRRRGSRTRAIA